MALLQFIPSGLAEGDVINVSSAAPDSFTGVNHAEGSFTASAAAGMGSGGLGVVAPPIATAANTYSLRFSDAVTTNTAYAVGGTFLFTSLPSATMQGPVQIASSADSGLVRSNVTAAGAVSLSIGTTTSAVSSQLLSAGTAYVFRLTATALNGAATAATLNVYVLGSSTPYITVTLTGGTTAAAGARARFIKQGTATLGTVYMRDLVSNGGSSTELPLPAILTAKTATDTSALAEGTTVLARAATTSDASALTEIQSAADIADQGADDQVLTDTSALAAAAAALDVSALTDASSLAASSSSADSATLSDSSSLAQAVTLAATDTAVQGEGVTAATATLTRTDSAAQSDASAPPAAAAATTDATTFTEASAVATTVATGDSATLSDSSSLSTGAPPSSPWLRTFGDVQAGTGTSTHTLPLGFTPAAGNLVVVIIGGQVTHTVSAGGWTEQLAPVNATELSVFTKVSDGTETSIVDVNNGVDYPVAYQVFEFTAGSSYLGGAGQTALARASQPDPLTGLPGTPVSVIGARDAPVTSLANVVATTWGGGWTGLPDQNLYVPGKGIGLAVGYLQTTATTAQQGSSIGDFGQTEAVTFALAVAAAPGPGTAVPAGPDTAVQSEAATTLAASSATTDSAAQAEGVSSVTTTLAALVDSATQADASTLAAGLASTDTAALLEVSLLDDGSGSPASTDTATQVETSTGLQASSLAGDSAAHSEGATTLLASLAPSDTFTTAEASQAVADTAVVDAAAMTDTSGVTRLDQVAGTVDYAGLVEGSTTTTAATAASDVGALGESSFLDDGSGSPSTTDSAAQAEGQTTVTASLAAADTTVLAEAVTIAAGPGAGDSAALTDTSSVSRLDQLASSDGVALTEASTVRTFDQLTAFDQQLLSELTDLFVLEATALTLGELVETTRTGTTITGGNY